MRAPFSRAEKLTILGVGAVVGMRVLGFSLVLAVIANHARALSIAEYGEARPLLVGLATGAYGFTLAALQLPLGALSDRVGRKPVLLAGVGLFLLGTLLAAWAPTVGWLVVARLVEGLGAVSSVATALLADVVPPERRATAMALVGIPVAASLLGGLILGPLLAPGIGVRGLFLAVAGLAIAAELVLVLAVREPPRHEPGAAGDVHVAPALRDPDLRRVDVAAFVNRFALMAFFVHMPVVAAHSLGIADRDLWKLVAAMVVLGAAPMVALARAADRGHLRRLAVAGIALSALGPVLFLALAHPVGAWAMLAGGVVFFAGFSALETFLPTMATGLAPPGRRGLAAGVFNTAQFLGSALGAVAGAVLGAAPLALGLVLAALGAAGVWAMATVRAARG